MSKYDRVYNINGQKDVSLMKLSMWILANLLELFEPEIQIREDSPRVLRSARMAQATNCVYVQKDGSSCVFSWNGDRIRVPDLST